MEKQTKPNGIIFFSILMSPKDIHNYVYNNRQERTYIVIDWTKITKKIKIFKIGKIPSLTILHRRYNISISTKYVLITKLIRI